MILVTKPFLPPIEEYQSYIKQIWERNWVTNNGPLVNELELQLKNILKVDHLLYTTSGTIALQIAIKALGLKGEIITTPFSYVATTSSIVWEGSTPVFVDIDEQTMNIDPSKIEAAITEKTTAILATHVYGNPCDIDAIKAIADKYGLKVIYDAAHCFGTTYKGKSVYGYGDITVASFHATKIFHTIEGGAVFTSDPELLKKMAYMRNFGHNGPEDFAELGINGKNSEFHAAMGLVNLKYIDSIIEKRKIQHARYNHARQYMKVRTIKLNPEGCFNYSYYPVIFENEASLLKAMEMLEANWISSRRYFFPTLNSLKYVTTAGTPVCDDLSRRVLCLPLYHNLSVEEIYLICRLILRTQNN
ncbi:MAG: DegT/DnrJ/EryC1/StrS family aminotransferase [Chitinophagaceae bacterium]